MNYRYDAAQQTLHFEAQSDVLSTNIERLNRIFSEALEKHTTVKLLELDLTRSKMIDSAGLNLIVSVVRTAGQRGARVRTRVDNPNVQRIMVFTRLDRHMEIVSG